MGEEGIAAADIVCGFFDSTDGADECVPADSVPEAWEMRCIRRWEWSNFQVLERGNICILQ